jgi:hypothetical protein
LIRLAFFLLGTGIRAIAAIIGQIVGFIGALFKIPGAAKKAAFWVRDRLGDIVGFVRGLPGRIAAVASGMFDSIKSSFVGVINWLISKWNGLQFTLPSVDTHLPGVGRIGGFTIGTPDIPYLASGGITTGPTLAMVGEGKEPEAILPLSKLAALMASRERPESARTAVAAGDRPLVGSLTLQSTGDLGDDLEEAMFTLRRIKRGGPHDGTL